MAITRLAPDALLEQNNLSGVVADIDEDTNSPDANWLTFSNNKADTVCRVSFPTPAHPPRLGADLQEFKIWVRKQPGAGTPQIRIELYEAGIFLATVLADTDVIDDVGQLFIAKWNLSLLTQTDGRDVECRIYGTAVGGSPSNRCTVEIGVVEWLVQGTIDIGFPAINANLTRNSGSTRISPINPANASGTITSVEIWANTDMSGVRVGTFYNTNGNTLKCRDSVTIGAVTSGSKRTFSGLSINVETGDYIGIYWTAGVIEADFDSSNGYAGYWWKSGEYIDPDDEATYALQLNWALSLYGTGEEVGGVTHLGAATLSGVGTLAGIGQGIFIGQATLSGTGTLASIGRLIAIGKATLSGVGTLSAIGSFWKYGAAALSGVGTLVSSGVITAIGKATLSGVGTLAAIGQRITYGVVTLTGQGTLVANGVITAIGQTTLSGVGTLAAIGTVVGGGVIHYGQAALSGIGTLSVAGSFWRYGKVTLSGVGSLSAILTKSVIHRLIKAFTGRGLSDTTNRDLSDDNDEFRELK